MHEFLVKSTEKCVIYSCIYCKMRHFYFENFEAKKGQNCVSANLPPKSCPKKFIGLRLN